MAGLMRPEKPSDIEGIRLVIQDAFKTIQYSDQRESIIVDQPRASDSLTISLVAVRDDSIIGHMAISPVRIGSQSQENRWYGLGPLAVSPQSQGQGIGSALVERALSHLKDRGAHGCVVLGSPEFYHKFAFTKRHNVDFGGGPAECLMLLQIAGSDPQGTVEYHAAFGVV